MIFLLVSMRQLFPFSILSMVRGEIPAFLASSVLVKRRFPLVSLTKLCPTKGTFLSLEGGQVRYTMGLSTIVARSNLLDA